MPAPIGDLLGMEAAPERVAAVDPIPRASAPPPPPPRASAPTMASGRLIKRTTIVY